MALIYIVLGIVVGVLASLLVDIFAPKAWHKLRARAEGVIGSPAP